MVTSVRDGRPQDVVRVGYDAIGERYHEWSHASPTRLRMGAASGRPAAHQRSRSDQTAMTRAVTECG